MLNKDLNTIPVKTLTKNIENLFYVNNTIWCYFYFIFLFLLVWFLYNNIINNLIKVNLFNSKNNFNSQKKRNLTQIFIKFIKNTFFIKFYKKIVFNTLI